MGGKLKGGKYFLKMLIIFIMRVFHFVFTHRVL